MADKTKSDSKEILKIKEVKRFSNKIYEAVIRLIPQLSPGLNIPEKEHIKKIISSNNSHLFSAETRDGKIAGLFTMASYVIPTGTRIWIEDVVVDKSERGKGIGKEMMLFAINYAKSMDATEIDLTSRPDRISANQLYQKLGFVKRETNAYRYKLK